MNTSKIIKGVVGGGRYTVTAPITQWDYGYIFQPIIEDLPTTYRLDFSNDEHQGTAYPVYCDAEGGEVPQSLIDTGKDIFVWLFYIGDGFGKTEYKWRIPNKLKPKNEEETPEPSQQSSIDQLIVRSNEAVTTAEASASEASASAQSAQGYAEQAETARDTAQTYANNAQTSANNASASASQASASATASAQSASQSAQIKADVEGMVDDAQGYADSASQSATASATSATQAQGYAQSASASAQSASGYASNAQTSANTASTKAQDASTSAQTASEKASEASASTSQALTYKTDAESAKTASQTAQGLAEQARADAITAKTGAESARDEAQNLVDGISGKVEQIDANTESIESLEEDRYTPYVVDSASGSIASFSDGADDIPLKSLVVDINPVQDTSSGDPSPENICPISGWTQVDVEQSGKNLFDIRQFAKEYPDKCVYDDTTGELTVTHYGALYIQGVTVDIPLDVSDGGYLQFEAKNVSGANFRIRIVYKDGSIVETSGTGTATEYVKIARAIPAKRLVAVRFNWSSSGEFKIKNFCISPTQTATPYEPYTGRSITIDLGQTVYGGRLDVLTGVLTVDMAMIKPTSVYSITQHSSGVYYCIVNNNLIPRGANKSGYFLVSDMFKKGYLNDGECYLTSNGIYLMAVLPQEITTKTDANVWMEANQPTFVYELAEPLTIQLTSNEVNSLLGTNNIWADSGDTSVEYRADTKLYIEKLTQPEEDDMIADSAITSGQFFMIGNTLYRALANIASGATITIGTNAQRVSLSDALNLVNA